MSVSVSASVSVSVSVFPKADSSGFQRTSPGSAALPHSVRGVLASTGGFTVQPGAHQHQQINAKLTAPIAGAGNPGKRVVRTPNKHDVSGDSQTPENATARIRKNIFFVNYILSIASGRKIKH